MDVREGVQLTELYEVADVCLVNHGEPALPWERDWTEADALLSADPEFALRDAARAAESVEHQDAALAAREAA